MLETALKFRDVFDKLGLPSALESDSDSDSDCDDNESSHRDYVPLVELVTPTIRDWKKVERLVIFLKEFYDLTHRVSGSLYVTSNSVFFEIGHTLKLLQTWMKHEDRDFKKMATRMKVKFNKYWGKVEKMNMLIDMAVILDPTCKMIGIRFALEDMLGKEEGDELFYIVKEASYKLFDEYKNFYTPSNLHSKPSPVVPISHEDGGSVFFRQNISDKIRRSMNTDGAYLRSEFDRYLIEQMGVDEPKDVLTWWRLNGRRFPILERLARDILAIPISTVASDSAFSAGGRHLDAFRSSLTPKMVQALICTQDWIRATRSQFIKKVDVEDNLRDIQQIENELNNSKLDDKMVFVS